LGKKLQYNVNAKEYLNLVNPFLNSKESSSSKPLVSKVLSALKSARIMRFSQLWTGFSTELLKDVQLVDVDGSRKEDEIRIELAEKVLLEALCAVCHIIQGCFVLRSEFVYERPQQHVKTPLLRQQLCRDWLICQFFRFFSVERAHLQDVMRLPIEESDELLNELAFRSKENGKAVWKFKLQPDLSFEREHPDIMTENERTILAMELRRKTELMPLIGTKKRKPALSPNKLLSDTAFAPNSDAQKSPLSLVVQKAIERLYEQNSILQIESAKKAFEQLQNDQLELQRFSLRQFEEQFVKSSVKLVNGAYSLFVTGEELVNVYRRIVVELFKANERVRKPDVQQKFEDWIKIKSTVELESVDQSFNEAIYLKVMREFAIFEKTNTWVLKSGNVIPT